MEEVWLWSNHLLREGVVKSGARLGVAVTGWQVGPVAFRVLH